MGTVEKLKRTSLVDQIVERLREDILSGKYPPGAALPPERELAAHYGVNRTSVKHALMKLAQMGFIDIKHGIGSLVLDYVADGGVELLEHLLTRAGSIDVELLTDLLELRVLLGGVMAHLAARKVKDTTILRELLERAAAVEDAAAMQAVDMEFFRALAAATGNRALMLLLNSVAMAYGRSAGHFVHAFEDARAVLSGLRRLLGAIECGDPEKARAAAERHLRTNSELMLRGWKRSSAPPNRRAANNANKRKAG